MTITVSAPGKILLVGGYLVLESPNTGLVVAVDKRFYSTVELKESDKEEEPFMLIVVKSPQFQQQWRYSYQKDNTSLSPDDSSNTSRNPFVEKTLRVSLLYLLRENIKNLVQIDITIRADNDFYSVVPHLEERNLDRSLESVLKLPAFLPAASVDGKILKTGLGSSACLVTSLVGALCHAFNQPTAVHNLAQISHCHAQGKVGSGFDVSAACHGSHIYQRFPKAVLANLLVQLDDPKASVLKTREMLQEMVESQWDGGIAEPLQIPSFLQVMLADVSGGSESPSMARIVLAWKSGFTDGKIPHWDDLARINKTIVKLLQQVSSHQVNENEKKSLAESTADQWNNQGTVGQLLFELKQAFAESRRHLKAMGHAAKVPIEPDEQTALADATLGLPGVVAALVPGAGGYDALACIYINEETLRHQIGKLWAEWSQAKVCPLGAQGGKSGEGIRVEPNQPNTAA